MPAWEDRDEDFEDSDAQEETDGSGVTITDFDGLILAPSDWTVGTIYEQIGRQIDLDPEFQRRNVWSFGTKSKFIELIFLGVPVPQVLLSSRKGGRSSFLVLDGKQRLTTIKEFIDGTLTNGSKFTLRGLTVLGDTIGDKNWEKISQDDDWRDRFMNATLRTAVLKGWEDEAVLYEIFYRLNSGSVRLSPMELRMSLHPGEFLKFIIKWTEEIGPLHHLLKKRGPDPRMGDVELSVRFLAFSDDSFEYRGDLKKFLDNCSLSYNKRFESEDFREYVFRSLAEMNLGIEAGMEIFGEDYFCRKWTEKGYERRFNRAIFDVLVGSLSRPDFRQWASKHASQTVEAYKNLCIKNNEFIRAVESTTKTPQNTRNRFRLWYQIVGEMSGLYLEIPKIS